MLTHARELVSGGLRYARGLRGFLAVTLDQAEAERILRHQLENREETFLRVLEFGIYANPRSPYRRLLLHAGFQFEDVRALVKGRGLDSALSQLHEQGVYVRLDEFKARVPVRRPGLEFPVSERDFDNPLLTTHYQGSTGGSRSSGSPVAFDFEYFAYEGANTLCALGATNLANRTVLLCQSAPPSAHGLSTTFRLARAGHMPARWFAPNTLSWNRQALQARALMAYTLVTARLAGRPIARPKHLQSADLTGVVDFLAKSSLQGQPAVVFCMPGQAVRICMAAERAGSAIDGTAFFGGGEPYTAGKAAVLARVGAVAMPSYGLTESGQLSFKCGSPSGPDDMHVMDDKVVILQRPVQLPSGPMVQGLFHTSLLTCAPKLMLNMESGDYGVIEERDCGCAWQKLGFPTHLHSVRSYEKLTSQGVTFMGSMLYELLEEKLPARFGGSATDYQLVEEEEDGLPRVSLFVSPRIGPVDEAKVIEVILDSVGFSDWSRRMADEWRHAGTLRIVRREPYATSSAKILLLHVLSRPLGSPAAPATKDGPVV